LERNNITCEIRQSLSCVVLFVRVCAKKEKEKERERATRTDRTTTTEPCSGFASWLSESALLLLLRRPRLHRRSKRAEAASAASFTTVPRHHRRHNNHHPHPPVQPHTDVYHLEREMSRWPGNHRRRRHRRRRRSWHSRTRSRRLPRSGLHSVRHAQSARPLRDLRLQWTPSMLHAPVACCRLPKAALRCSALRPSASCVWLLQPVLPQSLLHSLRTPSAAAPSSSQRQQQQQLLQGAIVRCR